MNLFLKNIIVIKLKNLIELKKVKIKLKERKIEL